MLGYIEAVLSGWKFAEAVWAILIIAALVALSGCSSFAVKTPEPGYTIVQTITHKIDGREPAEEKKSWLK